jgi:hypothetical protein
MPNRVSESLDYQDRMALADLIVGKDTSQRTAEHRGRQVGPLSLRQDVQPLVVDYVTHTGELLLFAPADPAVLGRTPALRNPNPTPRPTDPHVAT